MISIRRCDPASFEFICLNHTEWPVPTISSQRPSLVDCHRNSTQMQKPPNQIQHSETEIGHVLQRKTTKLARTAFLARRAVENARRWAEDIARLRSLLRLECLALASPLGSLRAALGVEEPVPPGERARVVADELLVVDVVVVSTGPEREEVVERPGELVAGVRVDGLEDTKNDPDVHGQDVKVLGDGAPQNGAADRAETEDHDFNRRRVFCCHTERRGVLVVDLVDVLVQRAPVHCAVGPVVPGVLENEEDCDLVGHCENGRERSGSLETEVLRHGVEEPDLREFDGEVRNEDELCALPLLLCGRDLLLWGD